MADDRNPPEPFVPNPAHNPADASLPGEGSDDMTDPKDNLPERDEKGIPIKEPTPEPDLFSEEERSSETDLSPTDPDEDEE
jgi:hypothetical protein